MSVPPVRSPVTQAIEGILAVVTDRDPTLADVDFAVDIHERTIADAPYQRDE